MRKVICLLSTILIMHTLCISVHAQDNSDIWVGKLDLAAKNPISDLFPLTNTDSYSNQPYFFNNHLLFYSEAIGDDPETQQIDTFVFNFTIGENKNLTQSLTSEYSPTPLPYKNGLSVIRVNPEGKQELWELDPQGNAKTHLVPVIEPVGYHVWLNENELLLFVLGEPHTLQRVDRLKPQTVGEIVDSNIGASLYQFKDSDWFFYTSSSEGNYLNAYNAITKKLIQVFSMPEKSEYFAMTPSGILLTSDGEKIWKRQILLKNDRPSVIDEFSEIKIAQIPCNEGVSRISVSPDESMIALVCPRQAKETEQK